MDTAHIRAGLAGALCLLAVVVHNPTSAAAHGLRGNCAGADLRGGSDTGRLKAMTCLLDTARRAHRVRRLELDPRLRVSAGAKADAIARCKRFDHDPCSQKRAAGRNRAGYARVPENLALAVNSSPREVLSKWLASREHRANLLNPHFRTTGLARRSAWLPEFGKVEIWVQQFGA